MATHRASVHRSAAPADSAVLKTEVDSPSPRSGHIPRDEIELQLQRILISPSFRNSKRNTQFLRFVVEKALAGSTSEIKERVIGVEVFDRPHDYDLSADPIVRGAAVELRRRIAQYYAETAHAGELRLELPLGTYVPVFYRPKAAQKSKEDSAAAETQDKPAEQSLAPSVPFEHPPRLVATSGRGWKTSAIVAGGVLAIALIGMAVAATYLKSHSAERALNAFWAPLMNSGSSVTVCVGDLNYIFKAHPFNGDLKLPPTANNLLNPNAGAALLRVGSILGSRGKRFTLRFADLTELNDLRQQPVIFIGGLNNQWTLRILTGLRFQLTNRPGGIGGAYSLIVDEKNPVATTWRTDTLAPFSSITRDYSLVTRMNDPLTGEPVIILCGLGPYGTAAASDFVSNPTYFSQFSKQAPKGWESQNIQIVLETTVVDGRVSVPRVVAEQVY